MLTSFFGNSKPVTLVFAIVYMLVFYVWSFWLYDAFPEQSDRWLQMGVVCTLLAMSMLVFNFIVRKNVLTAGNSYGIISMAVAVSLIPVLSEGWQEVAAVFCLLLAIRRIFSLRSERNLERKILDASLWIGIASLFHAASVLMIFPLIWSISIRAYSTPRFFIIPFFGLGSVGVLSWTYSLLRYGDSSWLVNRLPDFSFNLKLYGQWPLVYGLMTLATLILIVGLFLIANYNREARKDRPTVLLYGLTLFFLMIVGAISEQLDGSEWIFPASMLGIGSANLIDRLRRSEFKEVALWLLLLLPILPYLIRIFGIEQA